jgi:hypothetical protein
MTQTELTRAIMLAATKMTEIEPGIFQHEACSDVFDTEDPTETISRAIEYIELCNFEEGRQYGHDQAKQLLSTLK